MREILFRAKRMDDEAWMYGWYEKYSFGRWPLKCAIIPCDDAEDGYYHHVMVISETVGQFTGLTDKNGKKIFEGDVIQFHKFRDEPDWVGVISYDQCQYVATGKMPLAYKKPMDGEAFYCPFEVAVSGIDKATITVIGNIHDNPELLEG